MPQRQRDPGDQHEGPRRARPAALRPPMQRRGGIGERRRQPDIAGVKHRRMHREAGILQQRIEARAFERRRIEPQKRIGGEENEEQERRRQQALHAQRRRWSAARRRAARTRPRAE